MVANLPSMTASDNGNQQPDAQYKRSDRKVAPFESADQLDLHIQIER